MKHAARVAAGALLLLATLGCVPAPRPTPDPGPIILTPVPYPPIP